jgi:uncharacterized protein (DUF433 family)
MNVDNAVVTSDPDVMHGTPCFAGTRVPADFLVDALVAGRTVDYFLEEFPTVNRDQVLALLKWVGQVISQRPTPTVLVSWPPSTEAA